MVKATSSILLLLMKHFRLNHIYQFEYLCQHIVSLIADGTIYSLVDSNAFKIDIFRSTVMASLFFWSSSIKTWRDTCSRVTRFTPITTHKRRCTMLEIEVSKLFPFFTGRHPFPQAEHWVDVAIRLLDKIFSQYLFGLVACMSIWKCRGNSWSVLFEHFSIFRF